MYLLGHIHLFQEQGSTVVFQANTAGEMGGAIFAEELPVADKDMSIQLTAADFANNEASFEGGAVCLISETHDLSGQLSFANNTAANGGAIYIGIAAGSSDMVTVDFSSGTTELQHNRAVSSGGALAMGNAKVSACSPGTWRLSDALDYDAATTVCRLEDCVVAYLRLSHRSTLLQGPWYVLYCL